MRADQTLNLRPWRHPGRPERNIFRDRLETAAVAVLERLAARIRLEHLETDTMLARQQQIITVIAARFTLRAEGPGVTLQSKRMPGPEP